MKTSKKNKQTFASPEDVDLRNILEIEAKLNFPNVVNSDVLFEHVKANFNYAKESVEYLEKKADDLIRYLGLGTGLLGFLLNYSVKHFERESILLISIGFIFWLTSLVLALFIRRPNAYLYPAKSSQIFSFMDNYRTDANALKAWISIAYEKSIINHRKIGKKKARILNIAYFFLIFALVFFFLSFLRRTILPYVLRHLF